jgi:hypothetical protein
LKLCHVGLRVAFLATANQTYSQRLRASARDTGIYSRHSRYSLLEDFSFVLFVVEKNQPQPGKPDSPEMSMNCEPISRFMTIITGFNTSFCSFGNK